MDRLEFIKTVDSSFAKEILAFTDRNPIFQKYLHIAPSTRKPIIGIKFKDTKEALIWYVCHTGVRNDYGDKLFTEFQKTGKTSNDRKNTTIASINMLSPISSIKDVEDVTIKGVGPGAKGFIKMYFFDDREDVSYTDRIFLKGMAKLYGMEKITPAKAKKLSDEWKGPNKGIGSAMCFQIARYT